MLALLGCGLLEGVPLTDGALVYMYFHVLVRARLGEWLAFLQAPIGALDDFSSLYPLLPERG